MTDKEIREVLIPACEHCVLITQLKSQQVRLQAGTDVWKWVATTLGGALITSLILWAAWPAKAVTRQDMETFIQSYSPYAIDRQMVTSSLQKLEQGQSIINGRIDQLAERQNRVITIMEENGKKIR